MPDNTRKPAAPNQPPRPFEGVPDHAPTAPVWKYLVLAGLFVVWVLLLILVRVMGQG